MRRSLFFLILFLVWCVPSTSFAASTCYCYYGEKNDCAQIEISDFFGENQCQLGCAGKYKEILKKISYTESLEASGTSIWLECKAAHEAANPVEIKEATAVVLPKLNVDIPTVKFTPVLQKGGVLEINFLAEYIQGVYKYLIGISALLAIVFIMIGGFQWVMGGFSSRQIESGKKRIKNGVTGLVLVLSVVLILELVNPELTKLDPLPIPGIEAIPFDAIEHASDVEDESGDPGVEPPTGGGVALPFSAGGRKGLLAVTSILKPGDVYITPPRACEIPVPSQAESLPGVTINAKYLGMLDCNISSVTKKKKRGADKIKMVVLHEGFPGDNVKGMMGMWFSDFHYGKVVKCKLNKKTGEYNYVGCQKDGEKAVLQPSKKQTPIGSHFAITPSGSIYQMADVGHVMNHCCAVNNISVGIDIQFQKEGKINIYTDAQYTAIASLIKGLSKKYGFTISDSTVKGHCELGSHADPPNFDLKKLGEKIGVKLDPAAHKNPKCSWL